MDSMKVPVRLILWMNIKVYNYIYQLYKLYSYWKYIFIWKYFFPDSILDLSTVRSKTDFSSAIICDTAEKNQYKVLTDFEQECLSPKETDQETIETDHSHLNDSNKETFLKGKIYYFKFYLRLNFFLL